MERLISRAWFGIVVLFLAAWLAGGTVAVAQATPPQSSARIDWGIWIDPDGCMHWWADGGLEGYMVERVNPKNGRPVCLRQNTCLVENTDTLFATDSAQLTASGKARLTRFFRSIDAFGVAVYGHTDNRGAASYNQRLSERRAAAVANVARANGAVVEREMGFGKGRPLASNNTAAGMQKNRRVEVICYRW